MIRVRNATRALACLAVLSVALASPGCAAKGMVDPDGIAPLVSAICDRHDAYVKADKSLDPDKRDSQLTSSAILRADIKTALDTKHGAAKSQ